MTHHQPWATAPTVHTLFLSPKDVAAIVTHQGVAATLMGLVAAIREDFLRWPEFDKSARLASHSPDGVIELMPISDASRYSFKYVNGHPKNTALGLSTVMAFGVLADVATGCPKLMSELTLCTAMRTAATSVMAAMALARPNSRTMALIGNGAQSEFQALAFHHLMGINEIRLFDVDPRATAKLLNNLQNNPDAAKLRLIVCKNTREAVAGADIVTTLTADKTNATIISPDMIEPGMHINGVGGDCPGKTEIHPEVLRAAKVFVEYAPQTRIEGDLQHLPADFAVTELWQVLGGQQTGRDDGAQVTVFDSVGFALEDFSALRYVYAQALRLGFGVDLDLIPALDDPKDLYQLIRPNTTGRPTLASPRARAQANGIPSLNEMRAMPALV